jgi:hypothetical protein
VGSGGGGKAYRLDAEMMRDGRRVSCRTAHCAWGGRFVACVPCMQQRYAKVLPSVGNDIPTEGYASL